MSRSSLGRYHLLAVVVVVITAVSITLLSLALSRIETALPLTSLHRERDFSAFLLDVSRLESTLEVAASAPDETRIEAARLALDIVFVCLRDNQSLYQSNPSLTRYHRQLEAELHVLEPALAWKPGSPPQLAAHVQAVEQLRQSLQALNDQMSQVAMEQASAQQHYLGQFGRELTILLILFGAFGLFLVLFALRQNRIIQILGKQKAHLRESESSYRGLFDSVSEAIYLLDENWNFLDINSGAEQMYGYRRDELRGCGPDAMAAPGRNNLEQLYQDLRLALAGESRQFEFWGRRKNGEVFPQQVWLNRGRYFGRDVVVAMATDISQVKRAEQELRRSNGELEQFAYAISHDMRQPLRMITSYLQLLEKALRETLDSDTRVYLNFASEGSRRLDAMLVGLLDYSRVGRKNQPFDWVESRAAVNEALLFLRPAIDESHAEIRVEGAWPRLYASHDQLVRLFQNLIGNAVKYRAPEQTPEIEVHAEVAMGRWVVSIRDRGIGIRPDQIHRLFQVFQRLQSHASHEGAGVGLALCRKIVEHHGGEIRAESAGECLGSEFVFELPLRSPPETERETATPPSSDA
jgi:PAS domain S-box-containing protein